MARIEPTPPRAARHDPLLPLEPLGQAVSVLAQPGALTLGLLAGALSGALLGLAGSLAFVRSPVANVALPLVGLAVLAVWSIATGAVALASSRAADGQGGRIAPALTAALRRGPALMLTALPVFVLPAALLVVQFGVFALTRSPQDTILTDRPVALIAAVFAMLLLVDALALALASVALWVVVPYVVVDGRGPAVAYIRARDAFWRRPGWSVGLMAGVLALASAVSTALIGIVTVALVLVSSTQLLGANELVLLRFSEPLVQRSFMIPTGNFAAVVILASGIGAAIGGAVGIGQSFGIAGGAGLRRAVAGGGDEDPS